MILDEIQDEGEEIEHIEYSDGIFVYLKGRPYAHKGIPAIEAIQAVNQVKKLLFSASFGLFERANILLLPYYLPHEYQTATTRAIYQLTLFFSERLNLKNPEILAKVVSHVFEYDQAYRFRVQDLATETSKERLLSCPQKEIKRLLAINKKRDYTEVSTKFSKVTTLIHWGLYIPFVRSAFRNALESIDFKQLQFDENDKYWANQKLDYKYFGKTFEERQTL